MYFLSFSSRCEGDSPVGDKDRDIMDNIANYEEGEEEEESDYTDEEEEDQTEYDDDTLSRPFRSKKVSFSTSERRAVLKPDPEIKTLPGTNLYCIGPSETHEVPDGATDNLDSSFVDLSDDSFKPFVPQPKIDELKAPPRLLTMASAPSLGALAAERKRRPRAGNLTPLYLPETAHVDTSPRAFLQAMTGNSDGEGPGISFTNPEMTLKRMHNLVKRSFIANRTTSLDRSAMGRRGALNPFDLSSNVLERSESLQMVSVTPSQPVGEHSRVAIQSSGGIKVRRHAIQAEESPLLSDFEYYTVDFLGRRKVKKIPRWQSSTDFDELFEKEKEKRSKRTREKILEEERAKEAKEKAKALLENATLPGRSISQPLIRNNLNGRLAEQK